MTFRMYCNPKVDTAKLFVNGSVINDNGKYVLMITESVSEELNLTVTIVDLEEGDFANYVLEVTNPINTTEVNFTVTAESKFYCLTSLIMFCQLIHLLKDHINSIL